MKTSSRQWTYITLLVDQLSNFSFKNNCRTKNLSIILYIANIQQFYISPCNPKISPSCYTLLKKHQRNRSWNDHIMNLAKISDSKNSMWAARPMNEFRLRPYTVVSKLTSHRMNTLCWWGASGAGPRIWSIQLFSISKKAIPLFVLSNEAGWHDSILAEWYGT